ncbi:hypothetical protein PGTUg99_002925 [Puccinia graminis f. sp. tritici]|uniref:Uncharacterized protein n=1 Tax=Puccinia graminis f. sp. tritici TaxID=56615 RepID=A0A5B0RH33_PUCGR|nr:hypothetical protein PGTUg99_002925 [Puccinia graminis f. sp. tritici]
MSEVAVLRKELSNLQTRLEILEARLTTIPLAPVQISSRRLAKRKDKLVEDKEETSRVSIKPCKTSSSRSKRDAQTLRSRSFKVMRHLINVVDISHDEGRASELKKICINRDTTHHSATSRLPAMTAEESAKLKTTLTLALKAPAVPSNSQNKSHLSATLLRPTTNFRQSVEVKPMKEPLPPSSNLKQIPNTSSETPRLFHPKRTHKADLASSNKVANNKNSQAASELPVMKKLNTNTHSKLEGAVPKTSETLAVTRNLGNKKAEIIECNNLRRGCGRFALLKYDPAVLDLLPALVKDRRFLETKTAIDIENLPQALANLRQVLGIWEWKEGTSSATFHEYKTPELGTTISNKGFRFVGFGWRGDLGQQPPRIEELHEDISQGADTLRWYWFKDLWLLFYFD